MLLHAVKRDIAAVLRQSKMFSAGNAGEFTVFALAPAEALSAEERPSYIEIWIMYNVFHKNFRKPLDYLS